MSAELDEFMELIKRQEPLLPELEPFLELDGALPMLRHPLLYSVPIASAMSTDGPKFYGVVDFSMFGRGQGG